ncbi:alpha/beta fold hydrolase [Saccharopolyspora gloriosae]|uniref:alpha/beta fold hydrolase n=1 Tax=Saccharopolyspora gloriosae TaxID=455344 RepID=UPI001FB82FDA|nr:alpha/beta hydrolase [Saccharopolyspora gloriosae]
MTAPPQGVEVDHVEFPAGKIRYFRAGSSGPAIVLLHGGGLDNAMLSWRHTIPVLAADHRVYVPDLPGQGGSRPWHGRANQRTFEEVLRWLLDAWQVRDTMIVGLSMGGSIATGFTLRHPRRVRGLVLVGSGGLVSRLDHHLLSYLATRVDFVGSASAKLLARRRGLVRRVLAKQLFTGDRPVPDLESIVEEVSAEAGQRESVFSDWQRDSLGRRAMRINHGPHLDQINCPVMFIHGDQDNVVPVSSSQQAATAISGAQLHVIPGAGHWPNREKANEFNALLREFVNARS